MKQVFLSLVFIFSMSLGFSQENMTKIDTKPTVESKQNNNSFESTYAHYLDLLSSENSKKNEETHLQKNGTDVIYVSPIRYTTFLGFVTASYTVCYASSPCKVVSSTWWCGCLNYE